MKPGELLGRDWQVATEAKIAYPVSRKQLNLFLSAYLLFESKAKKILFRISNNGISSQRAKKSHHVTKSFRVTQNTGAFISIPTFT